MALTANEALKTKGENDIVDFDIDATTHIYRGSIVGITAAGYLTTAAPVATTAMARAGVAREEVNNTGAAGADSAEVYTAGEFLLTGSGFAVSDVGDIVYASADDTITLSATTGANLNVTLGYVTKFVSATQVWVKLLPFGVQS